MAAVTAAVATVIGVIISNLTSGLKGLGNVLKKIGKKIGKSLPGMLGAIAHFIFKTAGEVVGFLPQKAWILILGIVLVFVEQFKKKNR